MGKIPRLKKHKRGSAWIDTIDNFVIEDVSIRALLMENVILGSTHLRFVITWKSGHWITSY